MAPSIIFSIGTLVEVDNTKTGYIIKIDNTGTSNVIFKINYTVGYEIEENVNTSRCRSVSLRRASTTRSGIIRQAIPTSNNPPPSGNHSPPPSLTITPKTIGTPPTPLNAREYDRLQKAIKKSRTWISSDPSDLPLYKLLKDGKKKDEGWLFGVLPISICEEKKRDVNTRKGEGTLPGDVFFVYWIRIQRR